MQSKARAIGIFVIGGIALLISGIIAFTSSELFSRRMNFVMYFDSSLNGLEVGSPVSFRGVNIGHVTNIVLEIDKDQHKQKVITPVYVEIDPDRFKIASIAERIQLVSETPMTYMINQGLRAQLVTKSLITGQLNIELEFRPTYPARRVGKHDDIDEIPTIPSRFDLVQNTVTSVLEDLRQLPLEELVQNLIVTLENFAQLAETLNTHAGPIMTNAEEATAEAVPTLRKLRASLDKLDASLTESRQMFAGLNKQVERTGPQVDAGARSAVTAFDEFAAAMRALRELADYLERNPDALLTGKQDRR